MNTGAGDRDAHAMCLQPAVMALQVQEAGGCLEQQGPAYDTRVQGERWSGESPVLSLAPHSLRRRPKPQRTLEAGREYVPILHFVVAFP